MISRSFSYSMLELCFMKMCNQKKFNHLFLCRRAKLLHSKLLKPSTPFMLHSSCLRVLYLPILALKHLLEYGKMQNTLAMDVCRLGTVGY